MAANAVRWYGCVLRMEEKSNVLRMVLKLKWWIKKRKDVQSSHGRYK